MNEHREEWNTNFMAHGVYNIRCYTFSKKGRVVIKYWATLTPVRTRARPY